MRAAEPVRSRQGFATSPGEPGELGDRGECLVAHDPAVGAPAVVEMSPIGLVATGLVLLAIHLFAIAMTTALRSYSRSLLEERCDRIGGPERAEEVAHL